MKKIFWVILCVGAVFFGMRESFALKVSRVLDANTMRLDNGQDVILIGVLAPGPERNAELYKESLKNNVYVSDLEERGREAVEFLRDLLENQEVWMETDLLLQDKSGRSLVYLFVPTRMPNDLLLTPDQDKYYVKGEKFYSLFVNASLVSAGYAYSVNSPPNVKYQKIFSRLQEEAEKSGRNLWKESE